MLTEEFSVLFAASNVLSLLPRALKRMLHFPLDPNMSPGTTTMFISSRKNLKASQHSSLSGVCAHIYGSRDHYLIVM